MNRNAKIMAYLRTKGYDLRKIKGCDLNNSKIISRGLLKDEALTFLIYLQELQIPILGGDVLLMDENNEIRLILEGWYCEKEENETEEQYTKRSGILARDYICKYKNESVSDSTVFLFDIVYDRKKAVLS
jgi:hypothetical protein